MLTSKQQIDRLLRAGSTYFNLNPFEVLQLEHATPIDEIKKKYKRLSILVHPGLWFFFVADLIQNASILFR